MKTHGGPDALGVPRWDFSTNANACGPEPIALQAVREADATRYPDPHYTALREALGALHGVAPLRIVVAASASEFIVRLTGAVARRWPHATVHAPRPGYGDYAAAAQAQGLSMAVSPADAQLLWHTLPASPHGSSPAAPVTPCGAVLVIDRAYAPLRLQGDEPALPARAWQLWSPNKALGLTGVRGAYAIAPTADAELRHALDALAPSWPLGAHAVAMLEAWAQPMTQRWVQDSLVTLRDWKRQQVDACLSMGWTCEPSDMPFYVAHWSVEGDVGVVLARRLAHLRERGVKLRDATSLGLPGHVRLSVQPPEAQRALLRLWRDLQAATTPTDEVVR